jgi:glycosyltransferase involved in cell wall biosynthesis
MRNVEVSIIVPVYKVEKYIHRCIDSILAQKFSDFELILVDDGSPDKCPDICDEYAKRDSRIKVIHKENGGLSEARNRALDIAKGEYISFVDSDDYISENMINKVLEQMKYNNCDIGFCDYVKVIKGKLVKEKSTINAGIFTKEEALQLIIGDIISSHSWRHIYIHKLWNNVRFPVGRRFEDLATIYLTFCKANKIIHIKEDLYYYTIRDSSITYTQIDTNAVHIYYGFKERYEFCKNNYPQFLDIALSLVVKHALSLYNSKLLGLNAKIDEKLVKEIYILLKNNLVNIIKSDRICLADKFKIYLLIFNSPISYPTGLPKKKRKIAILKPTKKTTFPGKVKMHIN